MVNELIEILNLLVCENDVTETAIKSINAATDVADLIFDCMTI